MVFEKDEEMILLTESLTSVKDRNIKVEDMFTRDEKCDKDIEKIVQDGNSALHTFMKSVHKVKARLAVHYQL